MIKQLKRIIDWIAFHQIFEGRRRAILNRVYSQDDCMSKRGTYYLQESGDMLIHTSDGIRIMQVGHLANRAGYISSCIRTKNRYGYMKDCLHWFRDFSSREYKQQKIEHWNRILAMPNLDTDVRNMYVSAMQEAERLDRIYERIHHERN